MHPKILIIRFSSIGDIVLTTPIIRCLKQQLEDSSKIHFLTKKSFSPLIEANPYLNKIHTIKKKVSEILEDLQAENFDYIIDLHSNLRSRHVKRALKIQSFTFKKLNFEKWLLVNFKTNKLPQKHIVDRYFDAIKPLGVVNDGKRLDYFIKDELVVISKINEILPASHTSNYITIAIGGTYATKRMPEEKLINLCRLIKQPILLIGGKEDKEKAKNIALKSGNHVFNTCGLFSINESAMVVKNSISIITHDTGIMHIAAAFNKKIISVWGNTVPAFGMTPYLPNTESKIFEISGLRCRPCSKLGFNKCPKKHFHCMNLINENEIAEQLN